MDIGKILIIDDSLENLRLLTNVLEEQQYTVLQATNGDIGLKVASIASPDLILLDIRMPGLDGFDVCRRLKADNILHDIPVIFLSGLTDKSEKVKAFQAGGVDYVEKPIHREEVLARVHAHLQLYRLQSSLEQLVKERTQKIEQINNTLRAENLHRRQAEARYRHLYHNTPVMMYSIDKDMQLINVNDYWLKTMGYNREEVLGRKFIDFLTAESKIYAEQTILPRFFEDRAVDKVEYQMLKKNGTVIDVLLSAVIEKDYEGNETSLAFCVDITEQKRSEEDRRKLEVQLRQTQKLEAIGTLAGGIAHDFNNILTPILGYAQLELESASPESSLHKSLHSICTAGLRAKELVRQILAFSRKEEQELRPLLLIPVIKEALKLIKSSFPSTIQIIQELPTSDYRVIGDPIQIHQIIMNICTNAMQAMKESGGILEVRLQETELTEIDREQFNNLLTGKYCKLVISDTGPGMEPDILDRILEPYFTTKDAGEGTGLGLSVVHGIVHSLGGAIKIYSKPGKGSSFHIYLPLLPHTGEETIVQARPLPIGNERILLVEDEKEVADIIHDMLTQLGYRVNVISNSSEVVKIFTETPDQFDLVMTDLTMPGITGIHLAQQLTRYRNDIPIILCTGFIDFITEEKAREFGIRGVIMKPVIMRELAETIREVLDEQQGIDTPG